MRNRRPAHHAEPRGSRLQFLLGAVLGALVGAGAVALALLVLTDGDDPGAQPRPAATETVVEEGEQVTTGGSRILVDRPFRCQGRVDLDLVRVTMRRPVQDAISLGSNCTGRIGRVEVETWTADGIKVQNAGDVAHDLVIESGFVKCHAIAGEYHQDGVHAMGGRAITFRDLRVDCLGNSNFFVATGGQRVTTPTEIVCDGCVLGPNTGQTLFTADSIRSGARGTTICTGRFQAIRVEDGAQQRVDTENEVLPHDDPACEDVTGKGAAR